MSNVIKIFISYAHKDTQCKDELKEQFAPWENKGQIALWTDNEILPGQPWNEEIIYHLNEADVIIMLISAKFFTSKYIQSTEFKIALERHNKDKALAVGVIVKPCNWEETEIAKFQVLPIGATAIAGYQPNKRAEIYRQVSKRIMAIAFERQKN